MPKFTNVKDYWESRYKEGLNSGSGSYGVLAKYKASVINQLVKEEPINTVIEWGCGDGAQLKLAEYPQTLGLDISKKSIEDCIKLFRKDKSKSFMVYDPSHFHNMGQFISADLCLSLDVVYHLVEDDIYEDYMGNLFDSSNKYVLVYASNSDESSDAPHVKHREFTAWVKKNRPGFTFVKKYDNPHFPFDSERPNETTFAEFYLFSKV